VGIGDVTRIPDTARPPLGILAAMLALAIGIGLAWSWQRSVVHVSGQYLDAMANIRAPIKSITLTLQRAALESPHTLPLYGSSELYCCGDPYRPAQLFASQPTGFDVFAIGRSGIGNLLFMEMFGALGHALDGEKLVMLDSPPWFSNTDAVNAASYAGNFSPAIADAFVFDSPVSMPLLEAAAGRMLAYPETLEGRPLLRAAVEALADPTGLHLAGYYVLLPLGRVQSWIERMQDVAQTKHFIRGRKTMLPNPASHPRRLRWAAMARRATKIAERRDSTNPFGFPNGTYRFLLQRGDITSALDLYHSGSSNRDGQVYPVPTEWEQSVEGSVHWTDLRLAAAVLHELHAKPFIWSMPMPGFYDNFTVLSRRERQLYYDRWEHELERLGVPWLDFRDADEDLYFMTDTGAHFSPRGWLFADLALDMFWHGASIDQIRHALRNLGEEVPAPGTAIDWPSNARGLQETHR
jgi:D-alanyl-lipoteichoic acid biosynthesis protein DltD